MKNLKEHVVAFSDAIIAIIITFMMLEIPIKLLSTGDLDYFSMFRAIGIYFISFCFVGDLWYQGSLEFHKLKQLTNQQFVRYMLFLFLLSLIPPFTRLLVEDTNRQVVLMYGILSFAVTLLWDLLQRSFHGPVSADDDPEKLYIRKREGKRRLAMYAARLVLLVIAYFFPTFGLVIYLILPILSFLQNVVNKEEDLTLEQMDEPEKNFYLQRFGGEIRSRSGQKDSRIDLRNLANLRKNLALLRSSLNNDPDLVNNSEWWTSFNQQWAGELQKQEERIKEKLLTAQNQSEKNHLENELKRLELEKSRIQQRAETIRNRQLRAGKSRKGQGSENHHQQHKKK